MKWDTTGVLHGRKWFQINEARNKRATSVQHNQSTNAFNLLFQIVLTEKQKTKRYWKLANVELILKVPPTRFKLNTISYR